MHFSKLKMRLMCLILSLSFAFCSLGVVPVYADNTKDKLESELAGLNKQQKELVQEVSAISSKVEKTAKSLEDTRKELAKAKGLEQAQYESMKLRIKYMYENGNSSFLEALFSANCMAEFVSRSEYYAALTRYDRNQLKEYSRNKEEIQKKEASLEADQKQLTKLKKELSQKEYELSQQISQTSADLSKYEKQLAKAREAAEKAKENAGKTIVPVTPSKGTTSSSGGTGSNGSSFALSASASDVALLAALIECEAGTTNYEGMLAVGSVVVNRMKSPYYPNTLYGVIYQPGQFPPATSRKVERILARGVRASCSAAASDALSGKNNVGSCLQFRDASSKRPGTVIGDNVFF